MFTLLVSWLLVACVPGLLILAALGLGRLEREITHVPLTTPAVAAFLDHADAVDMHTLAREGIPEALEYLHRRLAQRELDPQPADVHSGPRHAALLFATDFCDLQEPDLPEPPHTHSHVNPEFKTTRYVNRV